MADAAEQSSRSNAPFGALSENKARLKPHASGLRLHNRLHVSVGIQVLLLIGTQSCFKLMNLKYMCLAWNHSDLHLRSFPFQCASMQM